MAPFRREQSPGFLVNHAARLFAYALSQRLSPHGVAPGQFPVLLLLWEHDGLTQAELARRLTIEQPTMANTLKRMERDGLIRRRADADDGRRAIVRLTRAAKSLEPVLTGAAREVNELALCSLSQQERRSLISILTRINGALLAAVEGETT